MLLLQSFSDRARRCQSLSFSFPEDSLAISALSFCFVLSSFHIVPFPSCDSPCSKIRHTRLLTPRNRLGGTSRENRSQEQTSTHRRRRRRLACAILVRIPCDVRQAVVFVLGAIDSSRGKVSVDHHHHHHHHHHHVPSASLDNPVSLETTYVIPTTDVSSLEHDDSLTNKKVRFIVQQQPASSLVNGNFTIAASTKTDGMTQRKNLSFVDAVNGKNLDLSTGLFSSSSSSPPAFVLPSSFSSFSTPSPDQHHRQSHTHFSSSSASSPSRTTITATDNKNLAASSSSVNNHPPFVGADSTAASTNNTTTTITLKEAIDTNLLDARSAYVVDTLEQR